MRPATKQTELSYSILNEKAGGKDIKALCSSVIYGPNASGKTNLIGALDVFRSIISRGHIHNTPRPDSPNYASCNLELIPNSTISKEEPVCFAISFIENESIFHYSLKIILGSFGKKDYPREIQEEVLSIDHKKVFSRNYNRLKINTQFIDQNSVQQSFHEKATNLERWLQHNLNSQELFLTGGFKSVISRDVADRVLHWFSRKLRIAFQANLINLTPDFPNKQSGRFYIDKLTNEMAKAFGIGANDVGYIYNEEMNAMQLSSHINEHITISSDAYESVGTIRIINMFPLLAATLINGGTLFVDEFDASLHPMALMSIINIFHNNEINKRHAQLIFNTHNPIFLNRNLFRRDEIKFVDRNETDHISELYSLADFGTSGKNGVRKNDDYMKNYFIDRYGAIRDLDFSPIFEEIMSKTGNEQ